MHLHAFILSIWVRCVFYQTHQDLVGLPKLVFLFFSIYLSNYFLIKNIFHDNLAQILLNQDNISELFIPKKFPTSATESKRKSSDFRALCPKDKWQKRKLIKEKSS